MLSSRFTEAEATVSLGASKLLAGSPIGTATTITSTGTTTGSSTAGVFRAKIAKGTETCVVLLTASCIVGSKTDATSSTVPTDKST